MRDDQHNMSPDELAARYSFQDLRPLTTDELKAREMAQLAGMTNSYRPLSFDDGPKIAAKLNLWGAVKRLFRQATARD